MSLAGHRPPLLPGVERYGHGVYRHDTYRHFLVKRRLAGSWQGSDRSTLSWDDSICVDVRHIEDGFDL